jgi:hypothetical protein
MATIFLMSTFRWQILQAMVDESPNKHRSLFAAQKNHVYFFKSTLKLAKNGTLRALGGQNSGPENFKCGWGLSYGLGKTPRKEYSRFGCFGTSQLTREKSIFSPIVHRVLWPPGTQKSTSFFFGDSNFS